MAPVAASLGCEAIIYLSAWHGLFFDELGGQPPHATLALMEAAGYSGASLMRQRIMGGEGRELLLNHLHHATNTPGKHVEALWGSPLANLSWTQAFFAAAAASACDGKHHVHLHHVVERANVVVSEAAARGCWSQHDVLQDAYLHDAANCSNSNSSSSLIFSLEDVANASAEVPAALRGVYEDARLYAGLSMGASFPLMRPLAKLLCLFIYQDDAVVKDSLFAEMPAPQSSSSAAAATTSSASLQWARSAGVVAGIIEYALHTASAAPRAVFSALHAQVRDADATHEASTSCGLLGGLSTSPAAPEDAAAIVAATAMLLRALMEQMIELDGWRQRHSSSASNNNATKKKSGAADGCGALLSAHILHNIHELLFASILGTSTQNLAARPTTSTTAHDHCGMRCATQRGLTLMEVDVLTRQLLPALLPQVGLEWPWSEMLRQCRTLERHAQGSQLAHHPSMVGAAHHEALTVVWSSEQLLEALLTALAPRSYAQRLQNSLPGSYDALLAELQLAANNNNNNTAAEDDGGDGAATATTTTTTDPLFQLPAYYRQAGEVMVEHLSKVGLGLSLQWQEAERVLRDAVNVLPMIVRLRALAPAASTSGRLNQPHVEHDEDEEMMMMDHHAPSGNDSWSRAAVQSWVNRYMAEVLLSAVVVRTQLAVPSHVQQLLRALAPLFHRLRAAIPRRTSWVERHGDDGLRFTMEAVRLMEHVGFRGYSLEWLPSVVPEDGGGASSTTTSLASSSATSLPYSIFAAVAYHMDIHLLHDGLRGAAHPAGPRASVRGAPSSNAQRYLSSHSSSADDAHARERATRFFSRAVGLHVLAATTAASEVEGSVLMSVSRAVQSAAGDASSSAAAATHHLASTTARDQALRQLYAWMWSVEMARRAAVREEAGQSSHHPSSSKRGRADDGGAAEPLTAEQREELLVGASYLLQNGPASMDGVVELSDVLTSVLQAFLPTAAAMDARGGGGGGDAVKGVASLLLRAGEEWSAEMMGGAASRAQLRVLMQQHASGAGNDAVIQSFVEQHGGLTTVEPSSLRSLVMARLHNSGTVDASVVAREMLRLVPTRLLHKLRRRRALEEELHELLTSDAAMASLFPGNARSEDATSWKRAVNLRLRHDAVLLQRQWKQWLELLTSVGLLADRDSNNNNNTTSSPPLSSTMEWLWSSPYTTELS